MKFHEISTLPFGFHEIALPSPYRNVYSYSYSVFIPTVHFGPTCVRVWTDGVKSRGAHAALLLLPLLLLLALAHAHAVHVAWLQPANFGHRDAP